MFWKTPTASKGSSFSCEIVILFHEQDLIISYLHVAKLIAWKIRYMHLIKKIIITNFWQTHRSALVEDNDQKETKQMHQ